MGLYDRDYYRDNRGPGFSLGAFGGYSAVTQIILINLAVWLIDVFSQLIAGKEAANQPDGGAWLYEYTSCTVDTLWQPWLWWQLITYGFTHSVRDPSHIIFNMLGLYIFGRDIEATRGKAEFWRMYLVALVVAGVLGLLWTLGTMPPATPDSSAPDSPALSPIILHFGASGAVYAVVVIAAIMNPHRTILFNLFIPMPLWLLATIWISLDIFGILGNSTGVGHAGHLAGAAYGAAYQYWGWDWGRFQFGLPIPRFPSRLKVFNPGPSDDELDAEVDRILAKMRETGEESLSKEERQTLQNASRRYQQRRR